MQPDERSRSKSTIDSGEPKVANNGVKGKIDTCLQNRVVRDKGIGPSIHGTKGNIDQSLCLEVMDNVGLVVNKLTVINEGIMREKGKLTEALTCSVR